jgi:uncharacterized alpha-E superfamily protein
MLVRIAQSLYWLSRYVERADYVARLLQVAGHMSAVRPDAELGSEWRSALVAAGVDEAFNDTHEFSEAAVIDYLAFDLENPSSIVSCIETARRNARAARTALTTEMWEAINGTWLDLSMRRHAARSSDDLIRFLDWVKERAGLFQGIYAGTMLRMDGFHFTRLGQFIERADNTARLLDVKYHVQLPSVQDVGGVIDHYQWLAVLRVVAARRAYRVLFKGVVEPSHVAELLILRPEFPRSLRYCFEHLAMHLDHIKGQDAQRAAEPKRLVNALDTQLRYARIENIMAGGLHEFLSDIVERNDVLGREIASAYLF